MTEPLKDRPELLIRRGPKPAPDERMDPVDVAPVRAAPLVTASQVKRREPTVAIGPRISVSTMEILDRAVAENGITQRQAIEEAIAAHWDKR